MYTVNKSHSADTHNNVAIWALSKAMVLDFVFCGRDPAGKGAPPKAVEGRKMPACFPKVPPFSSLGPEGFCKCAEIRDLEVGEVLGTNGVTLMKSQERRKQGQM